MQKYIQRAIIAQYAAMTLGGFISIAHASDVQNDVLKISSHAEIKIDKDFVQNLQMATRNSVLKYGQFDEHNMSKIFQKANDQADIKREQTYMYMYSTSMPIVALQNLIPQMKKMKSVHPDSTFYVVLNGFPKASFWKELRGIYKDDIKNLFSIKIHPKIYETYRLTHVPAWIKIDCPREFQFKKCDVERSFLAKGDISFLDFFELLVKRDTSYMQTYQQLIKAN